jgi:hypothetical protein
LCQGSRTTLYKRCVHEIYAGFGECARWDGLVERVTKYADDARHVVVEVGATAVLLAVAIMCTLSTCTVGVAASMKLLQD